MDNVVSEELPLVDTFPNRISANPKTERLPSSAEHCDSLNGGIKTGRNHFEAVKLKQAVQHNINFAASHENLSNFLSTADNLNADHHKTPEHRRSNSTIKRQACEVRIPKSKGTRLSKETISQFVTVD